jgi:hypothetical protein
MPPLNEGNISTEPDTSIISQAKELRTLLLNARVEGGTDCTDMDWRGELRNAPQRCEMLSPDTMLANVSLEDPSSASAALGKISSNDLIENEEFPHVNFVNEEGTQALSFIFYPGDVLNNYAALCLSRTMPSTVRDTLPDIEFRSGKGITLGMSKVEVIVKLGDCYSSYRNDHGHDLLSYSIKNFAQSDFLRRYDMPSYFACLEFDQDKLIDYRFGFDYP